MKLARLLYFNSTILGLALLISGCAGTPRKILGPEGVTYLQTEEGLKVWLADGFEFTGYDTLVVTETKLETQGRDEKETNRLNLMQKDLQQQLMTALQTSKLFSSVVTSDSQVKPGSKTLKLQNSIVRFSRGNTASRWMVGFGAGVPYVVVRGQMVDVADNKPRFRYDLDQAAEWFLGHYRGTEDLQNETVREVSKKLSGFMTKTAKHEKIEYKTD